jgi:asparagine synthase (glutamine-hydrolysing)
MCGITGIFDLQGANIDKKDIDLMNGTIAHRGPDGEGTFIAGPIGLGHRRLSIIDLAGGTQPMGNEDGEVQVVFNGEIYNYVELTAELAAKGHRFATKSDTEVIVHGYEEWGDRCVERFNGIFAFALWDNRRKKLFCARDHLGVKPFYYAVNNHRLIFGSEIKPLLAIDPSLRNVDHTALAELFTYGFFVPAPLTMFRDVKKLPAGHVLIAQGTEVSTARYWKGIVPRHEPAKMAAIEEEYRARVRESIRFQMRSDVPVGLFLSSGIDSVALLSQMREFSNGPVHTFTIGFEGGAATNETDDARAAAARFGATHHEWMVTPQEYMDYYKRYMRDLEEPTANETAAAFWFVSNLARKEVKVVLCGQGVDEPWAGYHRHLGIALSNLYGKLPHALTHSVLRPIVQALTANERLLRGVEFLDEPDALSRIAHVHTFFTGDMLKQLYLPWFSRELEEQRYDALLSMRHLFEEVKDRDLLTALLYIDTRTGLTDDLLMVADKTSMANGIEVRVPYLDYTLINFVESLPSSLKVHGLSGKYLHKKALSKWVGSETAFRKKKGFENPIAEWLRGPMLPYVRGLLLDGSASGDYFDKKYIEMMINDHASGKGRYLRHLSLLLSFELWHREFIR